MEKNMTDIFILSFDSFRLGNTKIQNNKNVHDFLLR